MSAHALQARFYRYDKRLEKQLKSKLVEHLTALSVDDRRMRFFAAINETAIQSYVDKLGKDDELFFTIKSLPGLDFKITGFLHVAKIDENSVEIGVSVDSTERGQGIATKLFDRAFLYVKSKGCKKIYINCLTTNVAMQRIVDKYKLTTTRDPDDPYTKTAVVEMKDSPDFYAYLKGLHQDQIALFDLALSKIGL